MKHFVFNIQKFGPVLSALIDPEKLNDLGPGNPDNYIKMKLDSNDPETCFKHTNIADQQAARACLAGLWLHHDLLDESHKISQAIDTPSGSFWHGIMHRREGDYWNSKYWFRKVGGHPALVTLDEEIKKIDTQNKLIHASWDPFKFVDLCESAIGTGSELESLCKQIQKLEWQILFDYCYKQATGSWD